MHVKVKVIFVKKKVFFFLISISIAAWKTLVSSLKHIRKSQIYSKNNNCFTRNGQQEVTTHLYMTSYRNFFFFALIISHNWLASLKRFNIFLNKTANLSTSLHKVTFITFLSKRRQKGSFAKTKILLTTRTLP